MLPGARNATFNWVCAEAWRPWGTPPGKPPDDAVDGAAGRGSTRAGAPPVAPSQGQHAGGKMTPRSLTEALRNHYNIT